MDWSRYEHAWRLRREGLKLREIGPRLGVSLERARQMVFIWEHRERFGYVMPDDPDFDLGSGDFELAEFTYQPPE